MSLRNKRILITAGPTWVPIDTVRVISNIATGETGILLAEKLQDLGAKVTLLLGPTESRCLSKKIRLIHFKFFGQLHKIILKEIRGKHYDIIIHSAAVADYRPEIKYSRKVKFGLKRWKITLVPTQKIIDSFKKLDRSSLLVGFKFEPDVRKEILLSRAKNLMFRANLDLVVANTIDKGRYLAYILGQDCIHGPLKSKNALVKKLIVLIGEK